MTEEITTTVQDEIRGYITIERQVQMLEQDLSDMKELLRQAETRVVNAFKADPMQGPISYDGRRWSIDDRKTVRPVAGHADEVVRWITANGGADLVQPSMHYKRRDSFLDSTLISDDGTVSVPDELVGLVQVNDFPVLQKRRG